MAFSSQQINSGLFIPTTSSFDVSRLYEVEVNSPEFKELLVRLYETINTIAIALNLKDSGYYFLQEFVNGQAYFPNPTLSSSTANQPVARQVFRTVVDFGMLPDTTFKSVAHNIAGINSAYTFTRIYACASDPVAFSYLPIPFASSVAADIISLQVDSTNVTITTASNRNAYTTTYVVLEYIKQ